MIRVTQLKLPLGHPPEALKAALAKKLKLSAFEIRDFQVFKRAHDARKKSAIVFIYSLDVTVRDEFGKPLPEGHEIVGDIDAWFLRGQ